MSDDGFTQMIDDSNKFFTELSQNNTKDWFTPRKDYFTEEIKRPSELFANLIADDFSQITGMAYKPKVFRIYRDIRFSKDKTPYNADLHIMWNPGSHRFAPAIFFASSPNRMIVGCSITRLKGAHLTRYRAFIDTYGDPFKEAVAKTGMYAANWGDPTLKRVPAPYEANHPHADLLKEKQISLQRDIGPEWREDGIYKTIKQAFRDLRPLQDLLLAKLG